MEMGEMFAPLVTEVLRSIVQHGADSHADSKELRMLRSVVRERLRRDMRYNAELLSEQKLDHNFRVLNLATDALDFVASQGVPLEIILNRSTSEKVLRSAAGDNAKHISHLLRLTTEAELIERLIHRIRIVRLRAQCDVGLGDAAYLRKLIVAAHLSLSEG